MEGYSKWLYLNSFFMSLHFFQHILKSLILILQVLYSAVFDSRITEQPSVILLNQDDINLMFSLKIKMLDVLSIACFSSIMV